jgi:integrase
MAISAIDRLPVRPVGYLIGLRPDSVTQAFARACDRIGIHDVRLHDLRHEATSRLFEAGWSIPEVAAVTGHSDWESLKRYTQLRPDDLANKMREHPRP